MLFRRCRRNPRRTGGAARLVHLKGARPHHGKTNVVAALMQANNPKTGVNRWALNVSITKVCKVVMQSGIPWSELPELQQWQTSLISRKLKAQKLDHWLIECMGLCRTRRVHRCHAQVLSQLYPVGVDVFSMITQFQTRIYWIIMSLSSGIYLWRLYKFKRKIIQAIW